VANFFWSNTGSQPILLARGEFTPVRGVPKQEWELPTIYTDPIHNKQGQRLKVGLYGIVYILFCGRLQIQLQWLKI